MKGKRIFSILLALVLMAGLLPAAALPALAADADTFSITNDYLSVSVSKDNGGFAVRTAEGSILKKSDNNKELLYHDGAYDTSFLTVQVDGKDYLFGGTYDGADKLSVTQDGDNGKVVAVWKVAGVTFTETLAIDSNVTHNGMLALSLAAVNTTGNPVPVKARLLLDTCLGEQDYGIYAFGTASQTTEIDRTEKMLVSGYDFSQFYAVDSGSDPQVSAYSLSPDTKPYQVAVGHWNHLASTLFDFTPLGTLDFTSNTNDAYRTADSACALYFDLGSVAGGGSGSFSTFYGVYSNSDVSDQQSVAVNLTAPTRLTLTADKSDFVRQSAKGAADFEIGVNLENYASATAKDLSNLTLAVRTTGNLRNLDETGAENAQWGYGAETPYTVVYKDLKVGGVLTRTLYLEAQKTNEAAYERVTVSVYDTSSTSNLTVNNLLGERSVYILLPGADGDVPKVSFTNMSPAAIYSSGTRHLYVTLTNPAMLGTDANARNWTLNAVSADGTKVVAIPQNNITINGTTGVMDVALTDDVQLAVGSWQLRLDWDANAVSSGLVPQKYATQTADILRFTVSAEVKYKNDSYGVVAVVQYDSMDGSTQKHAYRIKTFKDEADFTKFKAKESPYNTETYVEILLIFRGEFTVRHTTTDKGVTVPTYLSAVSTKTLDTATQKYTVDNCVTINGCMDFEGGTIAIYYESYKAQALNSAVCTEFDGELYTSDARTSIWKGKAIFTKLEQDKEFSLLPYTSDGGRSPGFQDSTIKLIWPSVAGAAQTIAGMVFKLAYGELGVMNSNGTEKGRVVSFSAKLSLSFTGENDDEDAETQQNFWNKFTSYWKDYKDGRSLYDYAYNKMDATNEALDWSNLDEQPDPNSKKISGSALVQDILYGCGEGFVGVHFKVDVAIQNYIDGLPKLTCSVEVNTIGNWAFKLEGSFKMETFTLQAKLSFKSYNNVPVPDDYYVYVGGFKPGLNVDTCGILWITGGGGGMSNIYKTIFCKGTVPPLKLIMSVGFSIMQVLNAQGTFSVGPTGVSASIEHLKVDGLNTELIPKAMYSIEWYPGLDMKASIKVDLFTIVTGSGYMVLKTDANYENPFFEAFARTSVNIPASVPVVGGMSLAAVNVGINTEKVWGSLKIVTLKLGLTYYWGADDVDFGTGEEAEPTYPQLLGSVVPIGYDEERAQTLYARIGTNVSVAGEAQIVDDFGGATLMSASPVIYSNGSRTLHKFNLGTYDSTTPSAIVSLSYDAASLEDAKNKASAFLVNSAQNMSGTPYTWTMYDGTNAETCDANVTWDKDTNKATFSLAVSDSAKFGTDWYISTGTTAASALLYGVTAIPEVTGVTGAAAAAGSTMNVTWTGSQLAGLDSLSFFLTPVNNNETVAGYSLGKLTTSLDDGSEALTVPADVPAGSYYLRCVYSKDDQTNGVVYSTDKITITNANTPAAAGALTVSAAGDLKLSVTVPQTSDTNTTGYEATVYNPDGTATDISALRYDRAASGATGFEIGGTYKDASGNSVGLAAGTAYKVGVTPYKLIDSDNDGTAEAIVYGAEVLSAPITLSNPATPTLTVTADKTRTVLSRTVAASSTTTETQNWDTYAASAVTFTAASDQAVTGTWALDKTVTASTEPAVTGSFTGTRSITVPLTGLTDGDHTLTFTGKNPATGDGFTQTYVFAVDTTPPRLMLTSPVNGSVFNKDGTLTITGVTDADALLSVTCDGSAVCTRRTVAELGGTIDAEGVFSATVSLTNPDASCTHAVVIKAQDAVGNNLSYTASVTHGGLGDLGALDIQYNNLTPQNGNIPVGNSNLTAQLRLLGTTKTGNVNFVVDTGNVTWTCTTVSGTASVDDSGKLTAAAGAQGFITARLEVTSGAYLTASSSFGADNGSGLVATNSTLGGTVTGGGYYNPGDTVTLTAVPNAGYSFTGWKLTGVTVSNTSAAAITFKMPSTGNVTATASFVSQNGGGKVLSGRILTADLPDGADPAQYIPYYFGDSGEKIYVSFSAAVDGKLLYLDPGKTCSFEKRSATFTDIATHWGREDVEFAASRSIVDGVGGGLFDPNGTMTRAMFVTVLWRIAGCPAVSGGSAFTDVPAGQWYTSAVAWASVNGIVDGYGGGRFGPSDPITREQLCAVILRFVQWSGLSLKAVKAAVTFADAAKIDTWAASAVSQCQTAGLVDGKNGNVFDPLGYATRAEACAILHRMIVSLLGANA